MPGITIAYIHHPETFVHFFLQVFDNILYAGQNKITVLPRRGSLLPWATAPTMPQ
jgi:hypothetical protein